MLKYVTALSLSLAMPIVALADDNPVEEITVEQADANDRQEERIDKFDIVLPDPVETKLRENVEIMRQLDEEMLQEIDVPEIDVHPEHQPEITDPANRDGSSSSSSSGGATLSAGNASDPGAEKEDSCNVAVCEDH